jgi:uncharacterized membrane protein YbaN (DUF454 family)
MRKLVKNRLLIALGWAFVGLGAIGVVLPVLPTTPFLIVALALFSKSSPRFHRMLLENRWVGPTLRQWEESKTLPRKTKLRAILLIVVVFSVSVTALTGRVELQGLLIAAAIVLVLFIWRLKERPTRT